MKRISILDCTLRDGGYLNNFDFGEKVIKNIIKNLSEANIDIIECGFLKSGILDKNKSLFNNIESIKRVIGKKKSELLYVAMIQYGAISIDEIEEYNGDSVDGIRLTFHEHEIEEAFILGEQLINKRYKVFMQPVGTMTYTDEALLKLIRGINRLNPYAFYIVDTLGTMYKNDLLRMYYLIDYNLNKNIIIGFHSHNNLQLSFANAQELMQLNTPRKLIIDSSVFGMGRGAGNLNTELLTHYINTNINNQYDNIKILEIIDEYIKPLSISYRWGYDAAYYIASITHCHPNYATFLINKQTMHVQDIYAILSKLDKVKRALYDKKYINEEYMKYMNHHIDDHEILVSIRREINNRKILLLAPGKSLGNNIEEIKSLIVKHNYYVISINFIPKSININMAFFSNMKRYDSIRHEINNVEKDFRIVVTSNVETDSRMDVCIVDYLGLINEEQDISDNAGMMCINLLSRIEIENVELAGFDGFSDNLKENYYEPAYYLDVSAEHLQKMNKAISDKIDKLSGKMKINFLMDSIYK